MADKTIAALTALTTPADGDLIPIVDVSDTTDSATGTTKKIAYSNISAGFPSSSTDNAIVRFDGTTGKLVQDSNLYISDITGGVIYVAPTSNSDLTISGYSATSGNNPGKSAYLYGGQGFGSGNGLNGGIFGGQGGATGGGGAAISQGGAGGATSGKGGNDESYGGNATNGDSDGGDVRHFPGLGHGSGRNGVNAFYANRSSTVGAIFALDNIASSDKTFTFANVTSKIGAMTSGAGVPTGSAPADIFIFYYDTSANKLYISKGVSAGSDWVILN